VIHRFVAESKSFSVKLEIALRGGFIGLIHFLLLLVVVERYEKILTPHQHQKEYFRKDL
jgi:hypothetical protein